MNQRPTPSTTEAVTLARRELLALGAGGLAVALLASAAPAPAADLRGIGAIAFDAFAVFDPGSLAVVAERLYPGRGTALATAWRTRQFEYSWLRCLARRYVDFERITEDALVFAARMLHVDLPPENRDALTQATFQLPAYADVTPALREVKDRGVRLALLSNMTPKMLRALIAHNGLEDLFDHVLSTDSIGTYKPDPRAYQLALDALRLPKAEIAFAAFGGWDAAGAKSFGYPTFWANRLKLPVEELGVVPDATGTVMPELVELVDGRQRRGRPPGP